MAQLNVTRQVFERQEKCRDNARNLAKQLSLFLSIKKHIPELRERKETQESVKQILELVTKVSNVIIENSRGGRWSLLRMSWFFSSCDFL